MPIRGEVEVTERHSIEIIKQRKFKKLTYRVKDLEV